MSLSLPLSSPPTHSPFPSIFHAGNQMQSFTPIRKMLYHLAASQGLYDSSDMQSVEYTRLTGTENKRGVAGVKGYTFHD